MADGTTPEVRVQEGVDIISLHDVPARVIVVKEYHPGRFSRDLATGKEKGSKKPNGTNSERELQKTNPFTRSCRLPVDLSSGREQAFL